MKYINYFILFLAICLLINVRFFDQTPNAAIGLRTKRTLASKQNWVYAQTRFYKLIIALTLCSSVGYYLHLISQQLLLVLSCGGIVLAGIITELLLKHREARV